ncbi:DUF783-domain-containing protein [Neocallimastix californiae]|uniref:DUF783-domain-containing protein n=1 Tax=Neocallimastix californiae TaxID=1754190 RepID=A0A1Y2D975_9FUNG|nr:DUF783-domain-containing protein [Neocallimastix californiae]|eukprot:ORY55809.1 DUF783-domain-containing protein [Neocallimastix californiae]
MDEGQYKSASREEWNSSLESLLIMIETLEINLHRSKQIYEMNDKEVKEYKLKTENIEKRIIEGKVEIEDLKKQLDLSKEERKNKLEYDEMARNINKYPSRNQIQKHMDSLNKQINTLEKEYNYYEETINLRKKQFHTLLVSADEILYSIKQNREGKEYDWIKSIDEMTEDLSQDDESEIDENEDDKEDGMLEEKEYIDQMDES